MKKLAGKASMREIRLFFDTNVLVYAHDKLSKFHLEAAALLNLALDDNEVIGIVAEQNLLELYRIITNLSAMTGEPLTPENASSLIEATYMTGSFEIVYPTVVTVRKTWELAVERNARSAKIFDLRLAAQALAAKADYLATYNIKDFSDIEGLLPLTPREIMVAIAP